MAASTASSSSVGVRSPSGRRRPASRRPPTTACQSWRRSLVPRTGSAGSSRRLGWRWLEPGPAYDSPADGRPHLARPRAHAQPHALGPAGHPRHLDAGPVPVRRVRAGGRHRRPGGTSGRPVVWATAQYLSYATRPRCSTSTSRWRPRDAASPRAGWWATWPTPRSSRSTPPSGPRPRHRGRVGGAAGRPAARRLRVPRAPLPRHRLDHGPHRRPAGRPGPGTRSRATPCRRRPLAAVGPDARPARGVLGASLAILGDYVPFGIGQALGRLGGGNSLDNTLRVYRLVPTEWVLLDIRIHAVAHGFGHGARAPVGRGRHAAGHRQPVDHRPVMDRRDGRRHGAREGGPENGPPACDSIRSCSATA